MLNIRVATQDDVADIAEIHEICWRHAYGFMPEEVLSNRDRSTVSSNGNAGLTKIAPIKTKPCLCLRITTNLWAFACANPMTTIC